MLFLGACAVDPHGDLANDPASGTPRTSALLMVERSASPSPSVNTAQVGARFVQFTNVAQNALPELLGTPSAPEGVGCTAQPLRDVDPGARAEVRLLDVGSLEVRADGRTLALEPRRLPDLFRVVSGVVYAGEGELSGNRWQFRAAGNGASRIPAFEVEAQAPDSLAELSLDGQPVAPNAVLRLARGPFALRWTRGEPGDFVVAHFEGVADGDRGNTISCSARDDAGSLEVDAVWSERVARVARGGRVVIHRIRVRPFALASVDSAAVVFDSSVAVRLASE
jgi:hypothetical protein